eukprot:TRINITY_DN3894_c1_g3_i2.p1 TRINITY_DN3894_c1_g3~~TRINITY_DN3894_c1_g3_i2.p1  ORF type:complete len:857 (+),score=218.67 TRINITY_DN3894_c1_g3_i2:61-2571(+)
MAALTNDGAAVIAREVALGAEEGSVGIHPRRRAAPAEAAATEAALAEEYRIAETAERIRALGAARVALQLPDSLLGDAFALSGALRRTLHADPSAPPVQLFVMADTLFAPCCVDEITAQHVAADMVVKYGHSCLTRTARVPVHFVPGAAPPPSPLLGVWITMLRRRAALAGLSEVVLAGPPEAVGWMREAERRAGAECAPEDPPVRVCTPAAGAAQPAACVIVSGCDVFPSGQNPLEAAVAFVGSPRSPALTPLLLWAEYASVRGSPAFLEVCDPEAEEHRGGEGLPQAAEERRRGLRRRLREREFLLERIRHAEAVAIVVVSPAISKYAACVEHVKAILGAAGKQAVVHVGEPNVPMLANYEEADIICVIGCPQTSLLDARGYPKPVVLPVEVAVAVGEFHLFSEDPPHLRFEYYSLELGPVLHALRPRTAAAEGEAAAAPCRYTRDGEPFTGPVWSIEVIWDTRNCRPVPQTDMENLFTELRVALKFIFDRDNVYHWDHTVAPMSGIYCNNIVLSTKQEEQCAREGINYSRVGDKQGADDHGLRTHASSLSRAFLTGCRDPKRHVVAIISSDIDFLGTVQDLRAVPGLRVALVHQLNATDALTSKAGTKRILWDELLRNATPGIEIARPRPAFLSTYQVGQTLEGVVNTWNRDKAFGFIRTGCGPDLFFHRQYADDARACSLGAQVEFVVAASDRRLGDFMARPVRISTAVRDAVYPAVVTAAGATAAAASSLASRRRRWQLALRACNCWGVTEWAAYVGAAGVARRHLVDGAEQPRGHQGQVSGCCASWASAVPAAGAWRSPARRRSKPYQTHERRTRGGSPRHGVEDGDGWN